MTTTTVILAAVVVARANVLNMPAGLASVEFVHVGRAGNAPDMRIMNDGTTGFGAVEYLYQIGKYEVSAAQYVEFLNAVARTDTYGLYCPHMANPVSDVGCNIQRNGSEGSYCYSVVADYANRPVNYVSYGNAMRFCNWLANGQPVGEQNLTTTEDGSYYLNGATDNDTLLAVTRKSDARYVIPTEDEWYKAAYHRNESTAGDYWIYPTRNDQAPAFEAPPGRTDPPGSANFKLGQGAPYYLNEVGAYLYSLSAYGTYDQGGSLWEWNEATLPPSYRGTRGGSWLSNSDIYLRSDQRYGFSPIREYNFIGFRIVRLYDRITADFDRDGDVDPADFTAFQNCASGPGVSSLGGEACRPADFDKDHDVDQDDFAVFQRCFSGQDIPANSICLD